MFDDTVSTSAVLVMATIDGDDAEIAFAPNGADLDCFRYDTVTGAGYASVMADVRAAVAELVHRHSLRTIHFFPACERRGRLFAREMERAGMAVGSVEVDGGILVAGCIP